MFLYFHRVFCLAFPCFQISIESFDFPNNLSACEMLGLCRPPPKKKVMLSDAHLSSRQACAFCLRCTNSVGCRVELLPIQSNAVLIDICHSLSVWIAGGKTKLEVQDLGQLHVDTLLLLLLGLSWAWKYFLELTTPGYIPRWVVRLMGGDLWPGAWHIFPSPS